jgi:hypothetical protein
MGSQKLGETATLGEDRTEQIPSHRRTRETQWQRVLQALRYELAWCLWPHQELFTLYIILAPGFPPTGTDVSPGDRGSQFRALPALKAVPSELKELLTAGFTGQSQYFYRLSRFKVGKGPFSCCPGPGDHHRAVNLKSPKK